MVVIYDTKKIIEDSEISDINVTCKCDMCDHYVIYITLCNMWLSYMILYYTSLSKSKIKKINGKKYENKK